MKLKFLAASAVLASSMGASVAAAPVQWTIGAGGNGHFYELVEEILTFVDARAAALAKVNLGESGYLATITSAAEQAFLDTVVTENNFAWLGGSDEATEMEWKWVDGPEAGDTFIYTNWNDSEPNDFFGEDHLVGWWSGNRWNDLSGISTVQYYVVEYNAPAPVPVPAALPLLAVALGALGFAARRRKAG